MGEPTPARTMSPKYLQVQTVLQSDVGTSLSAYRLRGHQFILDLLFILLNKEVYLLCIGAVCHSLSI